jgi:hypothetical protein
MAEKYSNRQEFDHTVPLCDPGQKLFQDAFEELCVEVYRGVNPPVVELEDCEDFLSWFGREYIDYVSEANGLVA